jgi:hypothetical protein
MIDPAVAADPALNVVDCNVPADDVPVTANDDRVPTLVILGCAAVVTVPAVVAEAAEPETLIPHVPDAPDPVVLGAPIVL